jgi:hypothetical protein
VKCLDQESVYTGSGEWFQEYCFVFLYTVGKFDLHLCALYGNRNTVTAFRMKQFTELLILSDYLESS